MSKLPTYEEIVALANDHTNKLLPLTPAEMPELFDLIRKISVDSFVEGYLAAVNRAGVDTSRRALTSC